MHPGRALFVHLPKTAGTSLRKRLEHHFGEVGIYPHESDVARVEYFSIEHLQARMRARGDEIRVVTGHFPLCTAEILGGGFTTLTILREPTERALSFLRHHREWSPEDRDKSLEEVYSDPQVFHGLVHNHMVKMFSLTPEEATAGTLARAGMLTRVEFTQERLTRAKERLESVDALGLHGRLDDFCGELAGRFGWNLGPPRHLMQAEPTAKRQATGEVSDAFHDRIAEDNAMDIELYRFAQRLYERRRAGQRSSGSSISTPLRV
ncbi:MAG: hypothetical protein ACRDL3_13705 [Solirubrobacterales bacterium]